MVLLGLNRFGKLRENMAYPCVKALSSDVHKTYRSICIQLLPHCLCVVSSAKDILLPEHLLNHLRDFAANPFFVPALHPSNQVKYGNVLPPAEWKRQAEVGTQRSVKIENLSSFSRFAGATHQQILRDTLGKNGLQCFRRNRHG